MMRTMAVAGALVLALGFAGAGLAQDHGDAMTDPALKRAEVLAFVGVKPGDRIADIIAGRFVRAFSQAVGPTGKVYAEETAEVVKAHPEVMKMLDSLASAPGYSNVVISRTPVNALDLPHHLDAVFIRQNYHDLHDKFM